MSQKRNLFQIAVGACLLVGLTAACAQAPQPSPTAAATATALPTNTLVPPTATATLTPTPEPTATAVLAADYYCIECHTNKDNLIANAQPVVVVEKESEGVG